MNEISTPAKPDLVDRLEALALETGATADEMDSAMREYLEHERWVDAMTQEALDEEANGAPMRDAEEVFAELRASLEQEIAAREFKNER